MLDWRYNAAWKYLEMNMAARSIINLCSRLDKLDDTIKEIETELQNTDITLIKWNGRDKSIFDQVQDFIKQYDGRKYCIIVENLSLVPTFVQVQLFNAIKIWNQMEVPVMMIGFDKTKYIYRMMKKYEYADTLFDYIQL